MISKLSEEGLEQSVKLACQILPMFENYHPAVMGAALANLVAVWALGFKGVGATTEERERLLQQHLRAVRNFMELATEEKRDH